MQAGLVSLYIFMVEVFQELNFAESAQTKHGMVKGQNALDGDHLACGLVNSRANTRCQ